MTALPKRIERNAAERRLENAAPDLLEALREMVLAGECEKFDASPVHNWRIRIARAAIAKATQP